MPASLVGSADTKVETWITLLDSEQKKIMDESEGMNNVEKRYSIGVYRDFESHFMSLPVVYGYTGKNKILSKDNTLVAFACAKHRGKLLTEKDFVSIEAENRRYAEMAEREVLDLFWSRIDDLYEIRDGHYFINPRYKGTKGRDNRQRVNVMLQELGIEPDAAIVPTEEVKVLNRI